ncbi:hypothetical protein [Planctomyces sp. SH-PL14]|uniref:hypothetical protein n=1 Tax=Planctomyces sp. SH-PL14 TaxID=1632864 RepID=UPI00078ECBA3|nr:hypothetical protein [Planctomyces sp. SH-PL14]AMV16453.1 hypothetical protein VT03_01095 [Planctomyces sp. SH-PL14]
MRMLLRQIFGAILCVAGIGALFLALVVYERYSRFELSEVLPPIATWELAGFLWFGKWPVVGLFALIGVLLLVIAPVDLHSEPEASPSSTATLVSDNTIGPMTPFGESWSSPAFRIDSSPGRLLGS